MNAIGFTQSILRPGVAWCIGVPGWRAPFNDQAMVMLCAIAGQESNWTSRVQGDNGPAHGFWQFERGGGVAGVLNSPAAAAMARGVCRAADVVPLASAVHARLATPQGDPVATAFARLLLWSDPDPLPDVDDVDGAWNYYDRNWRPGKPGPERWPRVHQMARDALGL